MQHASSQTPLARSRQRATLRASTSAVRYRQSTPNGAAIVIHQNPDTNQTGTKRQGVGGGAAIACGVIVK